MVVKRCIICNISTSKANEFDRGEPVSMFKCPKEEERRKLWSDLCGVEVSEISFICQNHFDKNCINNVGKHPRLRPDAIPTLNIKTKTTGTTTTENEGAALRENHESSEVTRNEDAVESVSDVEYKPLGIVPSILINEELFDELRTPKDIIVASKQCPKDVGSSSSKWICGNIEVDLESENVFSINCLHCQRAFPLTGSSDSFVQHMKTEHMPADEKPIRVPNALEELNIHIPEVKIEVEDDPETADISEDVLGNIDIIPELVNTTKSKRSAISDAQSDDEEEENTKKIRRDSQSIVDATTTSEDVSEVEMECDDSRDAKQIGSQDSHDSDGHGDLDKKTFAKKTARSTSGEKSRRSKKSKIDVEQISVEATDADLVEDFLIMLKDYPILWHRRQSAMKLYDDALAELMEKFNTKHQLSYSDVGLRESISRFKICCKRATFPAKYPEFHKLCNELDENSKKITHNCDRCHNFFFNEIDLQIHRYKMHRVGELPYKCKRCNYGFSNPATLAKHELNHERTRSFKCEICLRDFFTEHMLKTHMMGHENYVCEICGASFESISHFKRHKLHHDPPQEKCEYCDKAYYDKWLLSEHLKIHKNERQFKCQICSKGFNQRQGLRIHFRGVHKIKSNIRYYIDSN